MKAEIQHYRQGQRVDNYAPSQNPIACFKGKVDEVFQSYPDHTYFVAYTPNFSHSAPTWQDMTSFLADRLPHTLRVRAYSSLSNLGEETYVELSLITEPHE